MTEFRCPKCGQSLTVEAKTVQPKRSLSIRDVRALFSPDLEELLTFTEKDNDVIVKPKSFLGSENFAKVAHIIRANQGEYVSAGKNSHFKIPAKKE